MMRTKRVQIENMTFYVPIYPPRHDDAVRLAMGFLAHFVILFQYFVIMFQNCDRTSHPPSSLYTALPQCEIRGQALVIRIFLKLRGLLINWWYFGEYFTTNQYRSVPMQGVALAVWDFDGIGRHYYRLHHAP